MTLTDSTANGGRNECNAACLQCLGTVWPGVLSAASLAGIPIDCRPPGAGSGELGVGASALQSRRLSRLHEADALWWRSELSVQ